MSRIGVILGMLFLAVATWVFPSGKIVINEFMAANIHACLDPDTADFSDWIELCNIGDAPVDLAGYYLTDDLSDPFKWRLPSPAVIEPGIFLVIWSGEGKADRAPFNLSAEGEQIGLFDQGGYAVDTLTYPGQVADVSYGRYPDGENGWHYFMTPTPGESNMGPGLESNRQAPFPVFNTDGGMFVEPLAISIQAGEGAEIRYTTDGSVPSTFSPLHEGPITVERTTVIRARTYLPGLLPSDIATSTYIIGETTTLPVISIAAPAPFLFDEDIGITPGTCKEDELGMPPPFDWSANFWKQWERPVHIEYYTPEGVRGLDQDAGIAIFGGFLGRQLRQKAFTLYARDKYGDSDFDFPLFPSKPVNSFQRFILRASSNDYNRTFIRDAMMTSLVIGQMDIDYMAYRPALVYINGEFWGLYNIREKMNHFYPESNYGIDHDSVDLIEGFDHVARGDGSGYQELLAYVRDHDLSDPEDYEFVRSRIDMVEFMNYYLTEIYVVNFDWLYQNIKCWRDRGIEGRWRWMLYDLDWGFNGVDPFGSDQAPINAIQWILDRGEEGLLFQRLVENSDFRTEFAQRFVTHLQFTFAPPRVHDMIDSLAGKIAPEMPRQIERWGAIPNMEFWEEQLGQLHAFAEARPGYLFEQLNSTLLPDEKRTLHVGISDPGAGWISVFEVPCPPTFAGRWYRNIPLEIEAHANPGWRFVRWEGELESTDRRLYATFQEEAALEAVFEPRELPSIVINEIHYNPSAELQGPDEEYEFVELLNMETREVDVSGFRLAAAIDFSFPPGTILGPGELVLVAVNAPRYEDPGTRVFQFSNGRLDNAGEELLLVNDLDETIDRVHYDDHYPWPREPDGNGPSLELTDPSLDNSLASSWRVSPETGGSPGKRNATDVRERDLTTDAFSLTGVYPNPFTRQVTVSYRLGEASEVTLRIFNITGQEVWRSRDSGMKQPGVYRVSWEPAGMPGGVYCIRLSGNGTALSCKVVFSGGN